MFIDENLSKETLKDVTIVRMDLNGKRNDSSKIPHFSVAKDPCDRKSWEMVRLGNKDEPFSEDLERKISELSNFEVGDIVDVDVEPVAWTIVGNIRTLSGISYRYCSISRSV